MLAIRMQRTGRKAHAMFRVVVQDSRLTPTSGKIVVQLGSYDPHTKTATLDKEKAATYLKNGAQPSDRAARLFKSEGIKLPKWVALESKQKGAVKHPEKLRRNRPAEPVAEAPAEVPAEEAPAAEAPAETVVAESEPAVTEEATTEAETSEEKVEEEKA